MSINHGVCVCVRALLRNPSKWIIHAFDRFVYALSIYFGYTFWWCALWTFFSSSWDDCFCCCSFSAFPLFFYFFRCLFRYRLTECTDSQSTNIHLYRVKHTHDRETGTGTHQKKTKEPKSMRKKRQATTKWNRNQQQYYSGLIWNFIFFSAPIRMSNFFIYPAPVNQVWFCILVCVCAVCHMRMLLIHRVVRIHRNRF